MKALACCKCVKNQILHTKKSIIYPSLLEIRERKAEEREREREERERSPGKREEREHERQLQWGAEREGFCSDRFRLERGEEREGWEVGF